MNIIEFAKFKKMAGGNGATVEEYDGAIEIVDGDSQGKEQTNGD